MIVLKRPFLPPNSLCPPSFWCWFLNIIPHFNQIFNWRKCVSKSKQIWDRIDFPNGLFISLIPCRPWWDTFHFEMFHNSCSLARTPDWNMSLSCLVQQFIPLILSCKTATASQYLFFSSSWVNKAGSLFASQYLPCRAHSIKAPSSYNHSQKKSIKPTWNVRFHPRSSSYRRLVVLLVVWYGRALHGPPLLTDPTVGVGARRWFYCRWGSFGLRAKCWLGMRRGGLGGGGDQPAMIWCYNVYVSWKFMGSEMQNKRMKITRSMWTFIESLSKTFFIAKPDNSEEHFL